MLALFEGWRCVQFYYGTGFGGNSLVAQLAIECFAAAMYYTVTLFRTCG